MTEVEERGFAVVPNLLNATEVRNLIEELTAADITATRSRGVRNLASRVWAVADLAASRGPRSLAESVLGPGPRLVRSILFDKVPDANWAIRWHQDKTIAVERRLEVRGYGPWSTKEDVTSVQPPARILEDMVSIRIHLDDCGPDNGALQVIPGSHRRGKLSGAKADEWIATHPATTCAVGAGGALVMKPLLLHASPASLRPSHRRVVHLDYAVGDLDGGLQWSEMA